MDYIKNILALSIYIRLLSYIPLPVLYRMRLI